MVQCKDLSERELLEAVIAAKESRNAHKGCYPYDVLESRFPMKVVLAKMEKLVDKRALDHGVSLRTAWVEESYLLEHHPDLVARNKAARGF